MVVFALAQAATVCLALGCHKPERHLRENGPAEPVARTLRVEPRVQLLRTFPCSAKCHSERQSNPQKRKLVEFHTVRNTEFHHGDPAGWCYQCHAQQNIDRLVTEKGQLVTFDQAYELCGSCHGDKLRDWKLQVHGKTLGGWNGSQVRRSCTACHNPHNPRFVHLRPEPPPIPPEKTLRN